MQPDTRSAAQRCETHTFVTTDVCGCDGPPAPSAANGDYGVWSRGDRALVHAWLGRELAEEFIANDPEECVLVVFNGSEWVDV